MNTIRIILYGIIFGLVCVFLNELDTLVNDNKVENMIVYTLVLDEDE